MKIALAGNPNSGKTTLFNALTGSDQYVGNWPGVTVEKKEGRLLNNKDIMLIDLPGIYSLSPYTLEEVVTRDCLMHDKPDVIINLVDASNIERNLYLTTQLMEMGIPIIIALNMMDIVEKKGDIIDVNELEKEFACKIVRICAVKGEGIDKLIEIAVETGKKELHQPITCTFDEDIEKILFEFEEKIKGKVEYRHLRWYSIKIFEQDKRVLEKLRLQGDVEIEGKIKEAEESYDDDSESIITNGRYEYITKVRRKCVQRNENFESASDKIDKVLTNRFLAIPLFVLIMYSVYYISIQSVGAFLTAGVENLFGMISVFLKNVLIGMSAKPWLISLVVDGIFSGVFAVLSFVPQLTMLFFFLSILEDCGYMSRVAFIMDRIFRKFGLSGKSIIPMLVSTGCGVPGIMATRTIESDVDRKITAMVTTFIPCGAKLLIMSTVAGAFFGGSALVAISVYVIGILMVFLSGLILKKMKIFQSDPAPFVMELPKYLLPSAKNVFLHVWQRIKAFIIKAGTIIFLACAIIWVLSNFSWSFKMVDASESILASIGKLITPVFIPLGFGNWQASVSTLTGIAAKENLVSTFGVLLGKGDVGENGFAIYSQMRMLFPSAYGAFSFLIFNMLCAPCVAAIAAIKNELNSMSGMVFAILYQTLIAYFTSFVIYQFAYVLILHNPLSVWTLLACLVVCVFVYLAFIKKE